MLLVADAGGEDLEEGGDDWIVYTSPGDLMSVNTALEAAGVTVKGAELVMEPTNAAVVSVEDAKKVMRLVDKLEELDDIQNVYTRWNSQTRSQRLWSNHRRNVGLTGFRAVNVGIQSLAGGRRTLAFGTSSSCVRSVHSSLSGRFGVCRVVGIRPSERVRAL